MAPDGVFSLTDVQDQPVRAGRVTAFRQFLLLHVAARGWAVIDYQDPSLWPRASALVLTCCALAALHPRLARLASAVAASILLGKVLLSFPLTSNHLFVEFLLVFLAAFCDLDQEGERELFLRACRWLTALVLFYAGFQKLLYGTYFRGEFLAFAVAQVETFTSSLGRLLPAEDLARLRGYDPLAPASGPYRVSSPLFLLVSNGSYLLEMLLAVGLVLRRTRAAAVVATVAMVVAVEIAAREVFFGMLFIQLVLLYTQRDLTRAMLPALAGFYAYLLAMRLDLVPAWSFTN